MQCPNIELINGQPNLKIGGTTTYEYQYQNPNNTLYGNLTRPPLPKITVRLSPNQEIITVPEFRATFTIEGKTTTLGLADVTRAPLTIIDQPMNGYKCEVFLINTRVGGGGLVIISNYAILFTKSLETTGSLILGFVLTVGVVPPTLISPALVDRNTTVLHPTVTIGGQCVGIPTNKNYWTRVMLNPTAAIDVI